MEPEVMEKKKSQEASILLLTQEVRYVKKDLEKLNTNVEIVLQHYVQREEVDARFDRFQTEIDKRFEGCHSRIERKVEREDFNKLGALLEEHITGGNIKWGAVTQSVITAFITACVLGGTVLLAQQGLLK